MNAPEKHDDAPLDDEALKKEPPKLDAISPDDAPIAAGELLGDIDDYQKRIEVDWETAKAAYHARIDQIMEDFLQETLPKSVEDPEAPKPKESRPPKKKPAASSPFSEESDAMAERFEQILSRAERTVNPRDKKSRFIRYASREAARLALPAPKSAAPLRKKFVIGVAAAAALFTLVGASIFAFRLPAISPLPYAHTAGPLIANHRLYVVDWFRKALIGHALKKGLPIESIESIPNNFVTGFALSEKYLWTIDGFNAKILQHALTPEHEVLKEFAAPGKHPVGLCWNGGNLWSTDDETKLVYRHAANAPDDVLESFQLPEVNVTGFQIVGTRLWVLDGKTREVTLYRLQKNLKPLATLDLDPYLDRGLLGGGTPSGIFVDDAHLWLVTENPSRLLRLSRKVLPN